MTAEYSYYPDGSIRSLKNGNLYTEYAFDADKNLTGLKTTLGTEVLADNHYTYDFNGNRTEKQQINGTTRYTYDALNQLNKVQYPSYTEELYYDRAGNRTRRIAKGVEELYKYDSRNRLTEYTKGGVTTQFIYDNAGNLLRDDKAKYTYASDEMSSITHIVSENQVLNHYEYDAWGNMTVCEETVENRFRFNGQQYDPITQQYYLRARFYNPVIARFTQKDTYRGDGLNLYAYCANNPVYYEDPSGHMPACMKEAYDKVLAEGKSKAEAYKLAKEAYWKGKYGDRNPTVDIPDAQGMTRDQWKDAYRDARLESKPVTDLQRQIHDIIPVYRDDHQSGIHIEGSVHYLAYPDLY